MKLRIRGRTNAVAEMGSGLWAIGGCGTINPECIVANSRIHFPSDLDLDEHRQNKLTRSLHTLAEVIGPLKDSEHAYL